MTKYCIPDHNRTVHILKGEHQKRKQNFTSTLQVMYVLRVWACAM